MWVCVQVVYTHTHTHTAQMGYLDVSPDVRTRHLKGPNIPDGLNLGIYDKHIELPAKLLDYFLRSNQGNINQYSYMCTKHRHLESKINWRNFF